MVVQSKAVRTSIAFAFAGLGFAGANVVLARVLPAGEYARFSLVVALLHVAMSLAPLGADGLVNRGRVQPDGALLRRSVEAATLVAAAIVVAGALVYHLPAVDLGLLAAGTIGGGACTVAAAGFQAQQRFRLSFTLHQSSQTGFAVCALLAWIAGARTAALPLAIVASGHVVAATLGWRWHFDERGDAPQIATPYAWREGLAYAGINGVSLLLLQLERLAIPRLLTLADLATYAVLAAFVLSPFRVLQSGLGYTLLPRLRAAPDVAARRRLILHEAAVVFALVGAGSIALWYLTPPLVRLLLAGKYELAPSLILAALVTGVARLLSGITRASVSALATADELSRMNLLGIGALLVAALGATAGAHWGLVGIVYGTTAGWLAHAAAGAALLAPHLREGTAAEPGVPLPLAREGLVSDVESP